VSELWMLPECLNPGCYLSAAHPPGRCSLEKQTGPSSLLECSASAPRPGNIHPEFMVNAIKKRAEDVGARGSVSVYPWLSAGVVQDGHGVRVGHRVTHQSRAEHPGQVVHVHLGVHTQRDPGRATGGEHVSVINSNDSCSVLSLWHRCQTQGPRAGIGTARHFTWLPTA